MHFKQVLSLQTFAQAKYSLSFFYSTKEVILLYKQYS